MKDRTVGRHAAFAACLALALVVAPVPSLAAPAVTAAPPVAAGPAARVAPGEEVAFDDLPAYVGSEIIISTTNRTTRRAVLTGASSISINLKLVAAEGGFAMSMPRESILKVVLAPAGAATEAKN